MESWSLPAAFYLTITLWVATMTWREQQQTPPRPWPLHLCAALACLVWPLVVIAMLVTPKLSPLSAARPLSGRWRF